MLLGNRTLLQSHRILLVDDEDLLCWCIEMELGAQGFEVKSASSVQSAHDTLKTFDPDLIICDQGLPDGWGTDLIQSVRPRSIPVIMMTAFTPPQREELTAAGIGTCLRKPFDLDVLSREVRHQLRNGPPGNGGAQ